MIKSKTVTRIAVIVTIAHSALSLAHAQNSNFDKNRPETWCIVSSEYRIIPNILGFKAERAKEIIESCGLVWAGKPEAFATSYYPIGTVGLQNPPGGSLVKKGSGVAPSTSLGFHLPSFIGKNEVEVLKWMSVRQIANPTIAYVRHPSPIGEVVLQNPKDGVGHTFGNLIELTVSEGLFVDVPQLVGLKWAQVASKLTRLNLKAAHGGGDLASGAVQETNCELKTWYPVVASISPIAGTRIYEEDIVRIATKREERTTTVPYGANGEQCD